MSDFDQPSLVVEAGTHLVKAGFGGDDAPRAAFPPVIGRPRHLPSALLTQEQREACYVGDEAVSKRGIMNITTPLDPRTGEVDNWDDYEKLLRHTFHRELRAAPEDGRVLLTEPPMNSDRAREKTLELLNEKFQVAASFLAVDSMLALLASAGRTSGLVVDLGHCHGRCTSWLAGTSDSAGAHKVGDENFPELAMPPALCVGGGDLLTQELRSRLKSSGYVFELKWKQELVRDMVEKECEVTVALSNAAPAAASDEHKNYELPDGQLVRLEANHLHVPDVLFDRSLLSLDLSADEHAHRVPDPSALGLVDAVLAAAAPNPELLMTNIVLSGGSSMIPKLGQKLEAELNSRRPENTVKVVSPPERRWSTWIGGSIFSSLTTTYPMWMTKADYDEFGASLVTTRWPSGAAKFSSGSYTKAARS